MAIGAFMAANPAITSSLITTGGSMMDGMMGSSNSATTSNKILPFRGTTTLGETGKDGSGNFTQELSQPFKDVQTGGLGLAGSSLNQLGAFNNNPFQSSGFDLNQITGDQFNLLEGLQKDSRQDAILGLEDRLFQQGRLGSTGGGMEQRNLMDAISAQQSQNMASAFGQGLTGQQQMFGQELGTMQGQLSQQGLLASLGQGGLSMALSPEQALVQQLQSFGALADTESETESEDGGWF